MAWTRSTGVIVGARALRAFATGLMSVVIALHLAAQGLDLTGIGLFLSAGVVGGAVYAVALGRLVARFGRRAVLIGLTLASAAGAAGLLVDAGAAWWIACSAFGALAGVGGAGGAGPAQPLEQALLADESTDAERPHLFATYRFVSTVATALGGLAAGLPGWLGLRTAGLDWAIATFASALGLVAVAYLALPDPRPDPAQAEFVNPLRTPSRRLIVRLNGLFAVDQLGSSLTTASLMTYWFHERFGLSLEDLAGLSFAGQLLAAASMWLSVRLARRIGLVRTMAFTHLPGSLLLIALAFVERPELGVAIWLARGLLSQMDIPARDALMMTVVAPAERVAMASLHLVTRNGAGTLGPALATSLWQAFSAAAPIVAGGVLKAGYDLTLYAAYRDLEAGRTEASPAG